MPRIYRETVPSEKVELDGKFYRRYPQSGRMHLRNYFSRSGSFYHKDLWVKHNGTVPPGHDIHHKDHNPLNNDLSNLECLPRRDHVAAHPNIGRWDGQKEHLERINGLAKSWHSSAEGLAWHAENGRRAWDKREYKSLKCQCCAESFLSLVAGAKYCSKTCGTRDWAARHPEYPAQKRARQKARLQLNS